MKKEQVKHTLPTDSRTGNKIAIAKKLLTPFVVKKPETIPDRIDTLKEHINKTDSTESFLVRMCSAISVLESFHGKDIIQEYEKTLAFVSEHNLRLIEEEAILEFVTDAILSEDEASAAPTNTTDGVAKKDLPMGSTVKRKNKDVTNDYEESKIH